MTACRHCERPLDTDNVDGFCTRHCRRAARNVTEHDMATDWFAVKLRAFVVRECLPETEIARRSGTNNEELRAPVIRLSEITPN